MTIRATKIEVFGFSPERKAAWKDLAIQCQRMTNRLWQIWLCHHSSIGTAQIMRQHFDNKVSGRWPCTPLGEPLTKSADGRSFYRILSAEFPDVNVRTRGLLTNAWQSLLSKRKAANGNLPGWLSILFANESLPTFNRPQPIPFDHDNAKLICESGKYYVELRIERLADSGKSIVERCELMLLKRKCASVRAIMDRILSGEYKWKGSNLVFDRGKWFVSLCYELPNREPAGLDPNKTLFFRPGRRTPWRVMIGGDSWCFGGNGSHVEYARRAVIRERSSRKQHYRWAGSSQKGHGRKRACAVWTKLQSRWKDFTKRYNNEVTRQLINLAKSRGCGRIVYLQPKDEQRDSRFLSLAGNDHSSGMLWDYFQVDTMLSHKCGHEGIEYGAKPKKKNKPTARSVRGVRKVNESKRGVVVK